MSVIDASLKVRRRHQLFLWIQGVFQSVISHETVICSMGELEGRGFEIDHFSITEGREQFFANLCDIDGGRSKDWLSSGRARAIDRW